MWFKVLKKLVMPENLLGHTHSLPGQYVSDTELGAYYVGNLLQVKAIEPACPTKQFMVLKVMAPSGVGLQSVGVNGQFYLWGEIVTVPNSELPDWAMACAKQKAVELPKDWKPLTNWVKDYAHSKNVFLTAYGYDQVMASYGKAAQAVAEGIALPKAAFITAAEPEDDDTLPLGMIR